jgi:hypothetical protein
MAKRITNTYLNRGKENNGDNNNDDNEIINDREPIIRDDS